MPALRIRVGQRGDPRTCVLVESPVREPPSVAVVQCPGAVIEHRSFQPLELTPGEPQFLLRLVHAEPARTSHPSTCARRCSLLFNMVLSFMM